MAEEESKSHSNPVKPIDVSGHYDQVSKSKAARYEERPNSKIFILRKFNNFVKTCLIKKYIDLLKKQKDEIYALDLCCGRGGDLTKWNFEKIHYLIGADISHDSIQECKKRYLEKSANIFDAEFHVADCGQVNLWDDVVFCKKSIDITSCQFALHYAFESYAKAATILHNACANLRPGGYFVGIIPNCFQIIRILDKSVDHSFKNSICSVSMKDYKLNLFNSLYNFQLDELVDCPEYLVYFPLLVEMLKPHNMILVEVTPMTEFFISSLKSNFQTLIAMQALNFFDLADVEVLSITPPQSDSLSFPHLRHEYFKKPARFYNCRHKIMTISAEEWKIANLYTVFAFQRVEPLIDPNIDSKITNSIIIKDDGKNNEKLLY